MGSVIKSAAAVLAPVTTLATGGAAALGGALANGLTPKYTDTDALQNIANQQLAGAQDAQAQLNSLSTQRSDFGKALADQALGKAPSIAEAQLRMAMDKNLQQQMAAAKANRSVNPALAARLNVQQANQASQQTAQQAAVNRLAEQQANQQAFGQYLAQQQGAGANYLSGAGQSQSGVMNTQFANQQRGINMIQGLAQGGMQAALMSDKNLKTLVKKYNKGGMVKKMAKGGTVSAANAIPNIVGGAGIEDAMADGENMQQMGGNFGLLLSRLGQGNPQGLMAGGPMDNMGAFTPQVMPAMNSGMVMMASKGAVVPGQAQVAGDSEKNDTVPALLSPGEVVVPRTVVAKGEKAIADFVKQAVNKKKGKTDKVQKKSEGGQVDEFSPQSFLDSLKAVSYEYKNEAQGPGVGEGRRLGIMAQDLEKAGAVGKSMVQNTPNGKQVDMGAGFGAILAAQSSLNERLKQLESKYGKKKD